MNKQEKNMSTENKLVQLNIVVGTEKSYNEYHREWFKKKYNNDPEWREQHNKKTAEMYHKRIESDKGLREKLTKKGVERMNERYHTDPDYKAKVLARNKEYYNKRKQAKLMQKSVPANFVCAAFEA
jgi:hypothetical protein